MGFLCFAFGQVKEVTGRCTRLKCTSVELVCWWSRGSSGNIVYKKQVLNVQFNTFLDTFVFTNQNGMWLVVAVAAAMVLVVVMGRVG